MTISEAVAAGVALVRAGTHNKAEAARAILSETPEVGLSHDALRIRISSALVASPAATMSKLTEYCIKDGTLVNTIPYYWDKSDGLSLLVKNPNYIAPLGGGKGHIEEFKSYLELVRTEIKEEFKWAKITPHIKADKGVLMVPCIFDLHLGKLAWGEETGEDYDMKIAEARFVKAIEDLIRKTSGHNISRILFPIGNDIYNSDKATPFAQTTSGTPQQDDSRWQKMFRTGTRLITWAVNRLAEIAPVDVVTVFSNHDHERVFYLGEVINAVYESHPNVTVDNSPKVRKYYKFGGCLFGLAHGHNEKAASLPFTMAQEAKQQWSETHYREWLLGHLHHSKKIITETGKDYSGVKVTYLTSPSATDAWHFAKNFTGSIKGCEAFVYDEREGLIGSAVHNIF